MPKFSKFTSINKNYHKRNYKDAIAQIIPSNYFIEDITASGYTADPIDEIINSHIVGAQNIISLLNISAVGTVSGINNFSGISQFFVKQNAKTDVDTFNFQRDILAPINISFSDYATSAEWKTFVDSDLQPWLFLNNPDNNVAFNTLSGPYGNTAQAVHEYFVNALGWMYLLNTSGISTLQPSALISQRLYDLHSGSSYDTLDGVNDFTEYLWKSYYTSPIVSAIPDIIPPTFVSSLKTYTSGTQALDNIKTLNSVIYSRLGTDYLDYAVRDEFQNFELLSSVEGMTTGVAPAGAFHHLIQAMSYLMYDVDDQVDGLSELYDIDTVPEEFLPRLGELIGWEFIGADRDKWRGQLRDAVRMYKAKGTKHGLDIGLKALFGDNVYDLSGSLFELYESYIPFMIHYALATESPLFKDVGKFKENFTTQYSYGMATQLLGPNPDYSYQSPEENIKFCVDNILLYLVKNHRESFGNFDLEDPNFIFNYRGRDFPIPPYEEIAWYETATVTVSLLQALKEKLLCFGIPDTFVNAMGEYIVSHTLSGADNDIDIGNAFIFYTSSVSAAPNFSTVLDDLGNLKAKYLSLWQGRSSHFDGLFYADNFEYSKYVTAKNTNLGLQRALKVLETFVPAHAISRTKLITSFNETIAQAVYPCLYNNILVEDNILGSSVLNAYATSGTDMGSTRLSSTGMSKFLVDNLEDPLVSSNSFLYAARNNIRRRDLDFLLPTEGFYNRTGSNMPLSFYPSSLERSLPASGGGMEILGYNYSSCEFIPATEEITNENFAFGFGPQVHEPMNLFRDPTLSATTFLDSTDLDTNSEGRWRGAGQGPGGQVSSVGLKFGNDSIKDPTGKEYIRPLVFSGTTTTDIGKSIYQQNYAKGIPHNLPGLDGWKDNTWYTLSYYIKNYNMPGAKSTEVGYGEFEANIIGTTEDFKYGATRIKYYIPNTPDGLGYESGMTAKIYWDDEKPYSRILGIYYDKVGGGFYPQSTKIEPLTDGWSKVSHAIVARYSASGTDTGTAAPTPSLFARIFPYYVDQNDLDSVSGIPANKLPTIGEWRGVYLWGIMVTEGKFNSPPVFSSRLNPVWYGCETLDSSDSFNGIDTSNTFPCRGVSSHTLSSVLDGGNCSLYATRGQFPDIQKVMYNLFRERTSKEVQEILPYVSGEFGVSSEGWFDQATCLENSSTIIYTSSSKYSLHPNNLLEDPLLTFSSTPSKNAVVNQWVKSAGLEEDNAIHAAPSATFFSNKFAKNQLGDSLFYQQIPSGLSYQSNSVSGNYYLFSVFVKNINSPNVELQWKTVRANPASGITRPQAGTLSWDANNGGPTDSSGTWIGVFNPNYFDAYNPGIYGGTKIGPLSALTPVMASSFIDPIDITSSAAGPKTYPFTDEITNNLSRIIGPQGVGVTFPTVPKILEQRFYINQTAAECSSTWVADHPGGPTPVFVSGKEDADIAYCSAIKPLDLDISVNYSFKYNGSITSSGGGTVTKDISKAAWGATYFTPVVEEASATLSSVGEGDEMILGDQVQFYTRNGPFVPITTSALPKDFGYEKVTDDGWYRLWIKTQIGPQWETSRQSIPDQVLGNGLLGAGAQFTFNIFPAGSDINNKGSALIWGPMLHEIDKDGVTPLPFAEIFPEVTKKVFSQSWDDRTKFKFGQGIQKLYNDYTRTSPYLLKDKVGGPNIFSHTYGPLIFNGNLDVIGNENLVASSFNSDINIGENYVLKNTDKWQKGYTISPSATYVSSNVLPYTQNFDPRITTWQYGGSGAGALAASAVFPPWGPMRWGITSNVSGPSSINSTPVDHQFIVQGAYQTNTWDWGSLQVPAPHVAEYMTSAQLVSMFVKKIETPVSLTSTDSYVPNHGMTTTDQAASSAYFGINLVNESQEELSGVGYGTNAIEFAWSGVSTGVMDNSSVGVCAVQGGFGNATASSNPAPSGVTASDCGNGWWRVGCIVSAVPSAVDFPVGKFGASGFTSGETGRWHKIPRVKGTRQLFISPAGFGMQGVSSLTNSNYKGQYIWGIQIENLSPAQVLAFNDSTTSSFSDLSSSYHPVYNTGQKSFDIAIEGVTEYRDGSIISGIELVIPSGSEMPYTTDDLELSGLEVTSFDFDGVNYTSHPHSSYFKLFKLDPSLITQYPANPLINKGAILVTTKGIRTPRLRIPLSNCRYPAYRRDYVDYGTSSYWPQSHLVGDVCSVQNSVGGVASIDTTLTDEYLYRRSLPSTSGYHGYTYEPQPQVPFSTKTSNLLIPDHDYELRLTYTSFPNDFVNTYGGGNLKVWIHTLPEEGEILRAYDQHSNIGDNGWVWSWTPDGWVNTRATELEALGGMDLIKTKLAHSIEIPMKEGTAGGVGVATPDSIVDSGIKSVEVNQPGVKDETRLWVDKDPLGHLSKLNVGDTLYLEDGQVIGVITELEGVSDTENWPPKNHFSPAYGRISFADVMTVPIAVGDSVYISQELTEAGIWDPATLCLTPEGETVLTGPLRGLTLQNLYNSSIKFNTKNKINTQFRNLPLSYKNYPRGNKGLLHRVPSLEENFQYYVIDIFFDPSDSTDTILFNNISIIDKTYESYVTDYTPDKIPPILRFYDSITNKFVGTGNASREKYTTSGAYEASGGSRLNYRYQPAWGVHTSATTGAYTSIDFFEGKG
jgi:phage tail-like protein